MNDTTTSVNLALNDDTGNNPAAARTVRNARRVAVALLLLLGIGGVARAISNQADSKLLAQKTAEQARRTVQVTELKPGEAISKLTLAGTLRGREEAVIHARTNGYLKAWYKDLGEHVKQGELLAEIDTPEIDQELGQVRATRDQIRARQALAESSLARWQGLRERDAVSQQELDERSTALRQAQADLAAANANVQRLERLGSFKQLRAPFDGIVVRRNVDVGTLIAAGTSRELFALAQTGQLRIQVAVPQALAQGITVGQDAAVVVPEWPGKPFRGTVTRTAGAIDAATRSMQIEVALPNPDGKLLPGAFAEVRLTLASPKKPLVLPINTLTFDADGVSVAVVGKDGVVAVRPIKIGRDFGKNAEILDGVKRGEQVVVNPPDALLAGDTVSTIAWVAPGKDGKPDTGKGSEKAGKAGAGPAAGKADPAAGKADAAGKQGKPETAGKTEPAAGKGGDAAPAESPAMAAKSGGKA
ncbi:Multidrug resistance protein MdtA [Andreprevotia sp. IGB-42]|uniref:efflux RND transporter periplasmic adaptor subunit n=1 Tax=Andreprevotia sp. IGB-42 TaxID=2497473 RepID=UPI001357D3F9|nr:efflux RND transporter periplasmic adaptor subunit [Andreprevotia sp. IGB-42]KAF0813637.1 Multidrug resistance protein MdtA [Andreprevotia sp. IGB-42]